MVMSSLLYITFNSKDNDCQFISQNVLVMEIHFCNPLVASRNATLGG